MDCRWPTYPPCVLLLPWRVCPCRASLHAAIAHHTSYRPPKRRFLGHASRSRHGRFSFVGIKFCRLLENPIPRHFSNPGDRNRFRHGRFISFRLKHLCVILYVCCFGFCSRHSFHFHFLSFPIWQCLFYYVLVCWKSWTILWFGS